MDWTNTFLANLAVNGCLAKSARIAGISPASVYQRRQQDPDFAAAVDDAIEDSTDVLELEARRRAVQGVRKPVIYQGQRTPVWATDADGRPVIDPATSLPVQALDASGEPLYLTVTEYSDSLLAMLLKGNRRHKYGDKTEIMGENGKPIVIDETKKVSRIAALLALASARKDIG